MRRHQTSNVQRALRTGKAVLIIATVTTVCNSRADFNTTFAENGGTSLPFHQLARTYMAYYSQAVLSATTTPVDIVGIQFRLSQIPPAGFWPSTPATFSEYKVVLAEPTAQLVAAGGFGLTPASFASYYESPATVFDGVFTVPENGYQSLGGGTQPWGAAITFQTPYSYSGNGLVMAITHAGMGTDIPLPPGGLGFGTGVEGLADAVFSRSFDSSFSSSWEVSHGAPVSANFVTSAVPEPATLTAFGLWSMLVLGRRASRQLRGRRQIELAV